MPAIPICTAREPFIEPAHSAPIALLCRNDSISSSVFPLVSGSEAAMNNKPASQMIAQVQNVSEAFSAAFSSGKVYVSRKHAAHSAVTALRVFNG